MLFKTLLVSLAVLVACNAAHAAGVQAQCGAEAGRGYMLEGGVVPANSAGWYDDTMRGETIIRVDIDNGSADVRFRDATGIWQSVSDQGGSAQLWGAQDGAFMVAVTYPGATIETLLVGEIRDNTGTLIHTLSRVTDRISSARVMTAQCILVSF